MKWSRPTALALICLTGWIAPSITFAETSDSTDDQLPAAVEQEGAREYQDVATLQELESETFQPVVVGAGGFDISLLANAVGVAADAHLEAATTHKTKFERKHRVGAELLSIPAVRERFESTSMFGLVEHDQPSVRSYLDFFDGRGKRILAKWINQMGRYRPLIEQVLAEEGLPQDLIYVAMIESGFSPYATSPAAAAGVWQFIPSTAGDMGLRIDRWVDERRDPVKATHAAARYLKLLYAKFESWPLALAAYNGGPGLMAREVTRHNSNNYWRIQRNRGMYDETRRYVPKVIAAGLVTKNADIFGLDHVTQEEAIDFVEVEVPGGTRLATIAEAAGADFQQIRFLNPALIRRQTPPSETWPVRIPRASLTKFVAKFDSYTRTHGEESIRHVVQFGESLDDIGRHHGVTPRVIRVANGLESRDRVSYGEELLIPKKSLGTWKPRAKRQQTVIVPNAKLTIDGAKKWFYEVRAGDTLEVLSRGFDLNPADIALWNDLDPRAKLQPGLVLQLFLPTDREVATLALVDRTAVQAVTPGSTAAKRVVRAKKKPSGPKPRYHKVKSGESLWLVAQRYKVTVDDLKKWNRKKVGRKDIVQPGVQLVIYK